MISRCSLTCLWLLTVLSSTAFSQERPLVVAGYLPQYRITEWSGEVGPVTDVIVFGVKVTLAGKFDASRISAAHLAKVRAAKEKTGCRLLFCVGGWGKSSGFATMATDPELRQQFVQEVYEYCQQNDFDGVDYDWEYPEGEAEVRALQQMLTETKTKFAQHGWLVTIAQASWHRLGKACYDSLDRVHLMSYDHGFPQATMEKSKIDVQRLLDDGCPPEKIVLGLPFYGRDKQRKTRTYAQLTQHPDFHSETSLVDGFAFNGPAMVAEKVAYTQEQGLGGIMIWELGQDTTDDNSLLKSLDKALAE